MIGGDHAGKQGEGMEEAWRGGEEDHPAAGCREGGGEDTGLLRYPVWAGPSWPNFSSKLHRVPEVRLLIPTSQITKPRIEGKNSLAQVPLAGDCCLGGSSQVCAPGVGLVPGHQLQEV